MLISIVLLTTVSIRLTKYQAKQTYLFPFHITNNKFKKVIRIIWFKNGKQ